MESNSISDKIIIEYASIPDRVKAAVIDGILIIGAMYGASQLLGNFENVPDAIRIAIAVILFLLYEPLMVSLFGGTIGHMFSDITVRQENQPHENINFFKALVRWIIKVLLGWLSLVTISMTKNKKAVHDMAVQSIVIQR
ncbi:RDD family protein [Nonlabens sp. Hel1_33_55]|uniref:RDD family protein n=1 Tax=Nonlabens sp. Hel1_33_55 TaxID=1336802 RepID=UPI000875B8F4|nr:RDD family protein [Nonlabens sp. Hel1_33_55]SCY40755.1 RDD family protein [Nonlabens sp. Hel1_33_55]